MPEESGLEIHSPRLRGLLMFPGFKGDPWYVFVFTAEQFSGEMHENEESYLDWIRDADLLSLPLWPSDPIFLRWLHEDRFFSAQFTYDGDVRRDIRWHSIKYK